MKRGLSLFLLASLLLGPLVPLIPVARATSPISFTTTADWNSGTRSSIDTMTVTGTQCNAPGANKIYLNQTVGYLGIGATIGSGSCSMGVRGLPTSGLVASYDMATLAAGKLHDFSSNSRDATVGTITTATGDFGGAYDFNSSTSYASIPTFALSGTVLSLSMWIKPYNMVSVTTTLLGDAAQGNPGYIWLESLNGLLAWQYGTGAAHSAVAISSYLTAYNNTWVQIGIVSDYATGKVAFYRNGVLTNGWSVMTGALMPTTSRVRYIGSYSGSNFAWKGKIDEVLLYEGNLSSYMADLGTSARSLFKSSGKWTSPSQSNTNYPILIELTYGNVSASRYVSLLELATPLGMVFWSAAIATTSGSSFSIIPSFPVQAVSANWTVSLTMVGNTTGTAFVSDLTIGLQSITVPVDYTPLWIIFAVFLVLLGLGLLVHPIFQFMAGLAGFALTFELFTLTSDTLLAAITAFMAIAILITSTLRDWR